MQHKVLNPFKTNGIFLKLLTINSGWSILYIEAEGTGSMINFDVANSSDPDEMANSSDPDEMPHYVAFHLGLSCLPKYQLWGLQSRKV